MSLSPLVVYKDGRMEGHTRKRLSSLMLALSCSIFCFRHVHIDAFIDLFLYMLWVLGSGMVFHRKGWLIPDVVDIEPETYGI